MLGQQVCALADADPDVDVVVALDRRPTRAGAAGAGTRRLRPQQIDLARDDLKPLLEGASSLVHLAQSTGVSTPAGEVGDAELTRRVLDAAGDSGIAHVVLLSSATAYGAWANNPLPLTEDAPLRPNPGAAQPTQKAESERLALDWRDDHPDTTVTLLRPAVTVGENRVGWLARALWRGPVPVADADPPAQYLDVADLASAVDLARRARLDGPRNVAPDGWISGDTVRALAGGAPRVRLPERLALRLAQTGWRWGLAPTPPALLPYTVHPWVVANDKLRSEGWVPVRSNEEAFVAAHRAGPWATISPRRRQEIALGASAAALAGAVAAGGTLLRRHLRNR